MHQECIEFQGNTLHRHSNVVEEAALKLQSVDFALLFQTVDDIFGCRSAPIFSHISKSWLIFPPKSNRISQLNVWVESKKS